MLLPIANSWRDGCEPEKQRRSIKKAGRSTKLYQILSGEAGMALRARRLQLSMCSRSRCVRCCNTGTSLSICLVATGKLSSSQKPISSQARYRRFARHRTCMPPRWSRAGNFEHGQRTCADRPGCHSFGSRYGASAQKSAHPHHCRGR